MEIDKVFAQFFQQSQGDGGVVDELTGAVGADNPADDEILLRFKFQCVLRKNGVDFIGLLQGKHRLDHAGFLPGADQRFVGSFSQNELERPDNHRLSRTGFTRDTDESAVELPGQFIDEGKVADFQQGKHGDGGL